LGWEEGDFLAAYEAAQKKASQLTIDGSSIGDLLIDMVREKEKWELTAEELLAELRNRADDERKRQKSFPKQPNQLSSRLRRIVGALRDIGIWVGFEKGRARRVITLERDPRVFDQEAARQASEHARSEPPPEHQASYDWSSRDPYEARGPVEGNCVEPDCDQPLAAGSSYYCEFHARGGRAA
jgi:hypothetical protein